MSNPRVVVTKSKLDALANSVAIKSGVPVTMTIDEMKAAVDSIELPESEYYIYQDSDGYVRISETMPAVTSLGTILRFPGWLMRVGIMETLVNLDEDELQLSTKIVQEVEEVNESD